MEPSSSQIARHHWPFPALIAAAALIATVTTIDPAGSYPDMPQGPGLTTDEMFNVEEGVRLASTLPDFIVGRLTLDEAFGDARDRPAILPPNDARHVIGFHNPDHPPLGRLVLGLAHNVTRSLFPPHSHPPDSLVTACSRTGSAFAFAVLVFLVGWFSALWYGRNAGIAAAVALVLMPRVFGHAHLAALETVTNLTWCAVVFSIAHWWQGDSAPSWKTAGLTGILFGLALLTKIQAVLLPIPIAIWALWQWRTRAVLPLAIWSLIGLAVSFIGWPWLWLSPADHLLEYLGRTTDRLTLYVFYFGQRYTDVDTPWHYPAVMFLTTVPIGLHLLGCGGLFGGDRRLTTQPRELLLLGCLLFPLVLFALPGIAVYDGARLFLMVFPLWALFVGRGASRFIEWMAHKWSARKAIVAGILLLATQAYGLCLMHPCHLSFYNLLLGGTYGAERVGMELDYWGEGVTRELWHRTAAAVPEGSTISFFPVPHQFVLEDITRQSPIIRSHSIQLRPWTDSATSRPRYVISYRRRADPPGTPLFENLPTGAQRLVVVERAGVPLAALFEFSEAAME